MSWSLKEYPACQPDAIDFPVGKHMTMLHLLLELCSILVEALGRVPQSQEALFLGPKGAAVFLFHNL